jgi:hypothetical protein
MRAEPEPSEALPTQAYSTYVEEGGAEKARRRPWIGGQMARLFPPGS